MSCAANPKQYVLSHLRNDARQPMRRFLAAHGLALAEPGPIDHWNLTWTEFDGLMRPLNITLATCRCNDAEVKLPATVANEAAHWDDGEGPPGPSKHLFIEPAAIKAILSRKPVVRSFIRRYGIRPDWSTSTTLKKKGDTTDVSKGDEPQLMIFGHAQHWCVAQSAF